MKGLCRIALAVLFVAACGRDSAITGPDDLLAPNAPSSGGILAIGVDSVTGASIETNLDDYMPGEVVHLVGRGWSPNESVTLHMTEEPDTHADVDTNVVADASGGFSIHFYDVQEHDLGVTFTLTATGLTSGSRAVATFTDGRAIATATINTQSAVTVPPSTNLSFNVTGILTGNANNTLGALGVAVYLDNANPNTAVSLGCYDVNPDQGPSSPSISIPFNHTFVFVGPAGPAVYDVIVTSYADNACLTNAGSASLTLQNAITVANPNTAPTLSGVPTTAQSIPELTLYTFDANAVDTDVPAQTLTFSIVGSLPAGATFNTGTGVFEWTPTEAQGPSGPHAFTVRVSDGIANTDQLVTLNVTEVNAAPSLLNVPASATIAELAPYTFNADATDSDVPVQTLTFSLNGHPTGSAIDPSTGVFTWTPTEAQGPGTYTFDVRVGDGVTTTSQSITLTVSEANASPVITGVPATASIPEMVLYSFDANATDADHPPQTLTFSLVGEPGGATINGSTGVFNWTPTEAQGPGSYTFLVRVTDGVDHTDAAITITVSEVNLAPALNAIGNKSGDEGTLISFTASATDADVPANTLTFSLVGAPAGANITAGGAFTWTPTEAQGPNDYTFTVRVTDNGSPNLSDEEEITVHVDEVNVAPVLAPIGNKSGDELTLITFDANASDSDVPANTLTFSLDAGAPSGASIDPTTGVFTWTPTEAQGPGNYPVTVRVTDNGLPVLSGYETITVHVDEVNVAPVLNAVGNKSGNEESLITFSASATDADLPANTLTYSLQGSVPAGASITPAGVFTWTPTEAQGPNSYSITVRVTDSGTPSLNDEETITITVNEVNVAPVLGAIGNKTVDEGSLLTFTASATDADIPANTLSYSLDVGAPVGASINPTTGVFTWTPTDGPTQSTSITVRVTDNGSPAMSDYETITVTVNNVDPVIGPSSNAPLVPVPVGPNNVTITWNFDDPGADTWTCQVEWDAGLGFTDATYVPTKGCNATASLAAGIYTVRIRVNDDDAGTDTESMTAYIVVYDPNGGFVTGGGWINSPTGAYVAEPGLTGKATFGFTSKYVPGKNVPTGNTEFQFHAGNLNFKSTVYEWLVVAGDRAQFKGDGTINGVGGYGFLLTAIDGSPDKFRIKIVNRATSAVVYDNQAGYDDDSPAATILGGGSIVIHTKK
jgi:hypothetical protein